jgi:hypothetical protein
METIETNYKPSQTERSSPIHWIVGTERFLRMLEVSVSALRRRQKRVQLELKKPGLTADRDRLRELLTELERISRALRGQSAGGLQ